MKAAILAIALAIGGTAVAQTTNTMGQGGQSVAPGNQAPERDARGIPVVSDPAEAPAGFNQPPQVGGTGASPSAPPTPQPATENYPICSRTVTDNCVQAYERGVRRPQ